jgi:hypothetical protein
VPKSDKHATAWVNGAPEGTVRPGPQVSAPSNRVNVAFPFSQIKVEEPSRELADLATLVVDLLRELSEWVPEERLGELRERAERVAQRLR